MNPRAASTASNKTMDQALSESIADVLSAQTVAADTARRALGLLEIQAERLKTDDRYRVVDPRTITNVCAEILEKATVDSRPVVERWLAMQSDLITLWQTTANRLLFDTPATPVISPGASDKRFKDPAWDTLPFDYVKQFYLLTSRFLQSSVGAINGVDPHIKHIAEFYTRQFVNALAPTNFVQSNPVVMKATIERQGRNLVEGMHNLLEDAERGGGRLSLKMSDLDAFKLGENIASSAGKVIFQNELIQLIQYDPSTVTVHRCPLLIVPPWINKFYILDLKPKNSFIKWCVENGHTVFVISWINPGPELAGMSFADYMLEGPRAAIDAIEQATGETEVNAIGYCIGGTLLASTLAYMAARNEHRVRTATFFTTLLDFSNVGDISVFIDDAQLELADAHMKRRGYLEGHHMGDAFNLMRENDLIWSFVVNNYLLGRSPPAFDLLYWNSDTTRMPATMQSFYLRNMYLRNLLRQAGGITLANVPIDLRRISVPAYFLSAREDHIAPWRTAYAGTKLLSGPVRFVLGASGHIAGVINPPQANKYGFWTSEKLPDDPEAWLSTADHHSGSWWTDWKNWIAGYTGDETSARVPGAGGLKPIEDAPGSYVRARAA